MRVSALAGLAGVTVLGCVLATLSGCKPGGRNSDGEPNYLDVVSTDPVCGSAGAFLDQTIKIRFNTAIDPNTVNGGTVVITDPTGADVPGNYYTNFDTVVFTPTNFFVPNTQYSIRVKGQPNSPFMVLSFAGDPLLKDFFCSFTMGTQFTFDNTPPNLMGLYVTGDPAAAQPAGGVDMISLPFCLSGGTLPACTPTATPANASPNTSVIMDFDEGMDINSFIVSGTPAASDSFQLWQGALPVALGGPGGGAQIPGTFVIQRARTRVVFLPTGGLTPSQTFFVVLSQRNTGVTPAINSVTDDSTNPGPNDVVGATIVASFQTRTALSPGPAGSPLFENFLTVNGNASGNNTTGGGLDTLNTTASWDISFGGPPATGALVSNLNTLLAGDGSDGTLTISGTLNLDTSSRPLGWNFVNFTVSGTGILTFTGPNAAVIRAQNQISVAGNVILGRWPTGVGTPPTPDPNDGGDQTSFNAGPTFGGSGRAGGGNGGAASGTPNAPGAPGAGVAGGGGGFSGDPAAFPATIPAGGGGGGHATAGSSGQGGNPGVGGLAQPQPTVAALRPGSGGGGGGMDDDGIGTQLGQGSFDAGDDCGAGGGAGGGALRLSAGGNISLTGAIYADGGRGGYYCGNSGTGNCPPPVGTRTVFYNGGAGGGGSGGVIFAQAGGNLDLSNATLSAVLGGRGISEAEELGPPGGSGGAGGDGWVILEDLDGLTTGTPAAINPSGTPGFVSGPLSISAAGRSLWYDSGVDDPDWISGAPAAPVINSQPNNGILSIYVQGADADASGRPDPSTYTNWVLIWVHNGGGTSASFPNMDSNAIEPGPAVPPVQQAGNTPLPGQPVVGLVNGVDRFRFLRFHVQFTVDSTAPAVGNPQVDDIRIDFGN